jgi:DNA-binding LacI/PurR family transcriptional regulator
MSIPNRRPTLHDVAALAGVSHMTVSRVVRGSHAVAGATAQKVQWAIAKLGYRADPALSALAAYRSRVGGRGRGSTLAFLDCDGDAYSDLVRQGARAEAERLGYALESHRIQPAPASQRQLARALFHRGVRGLLFGPSNTPWTFTGWNWQAFAAVSLGAISHQPAMNTVAMDYFENASRGYETLRATGCRRIALAVDSVLESRTGHRWIGGYAAQSPKPQLIYNQARISVPELKRWIQQHRVDGVLTIHDRVWRAAGLLGVVVVFLNEFECPPELPHFVTDSRRIGEEGVRLIHHQILNHDFGLPEQTRMVALQAVMVKGDTSLTGL